MSPVVLPTMLRWGSLASIACLLLGLVSGCGKSTAGSAPAAAPKKGPIDSRLIGKWECRKGFAGTLGMEFHNDNTITVRDTKADKTNTYTAHWYVFEEGKEQLKIHLRVPKKDYELRVVKFLDGNSFELKSGGTILGRFEKR